MIAKHIATPQGGSGYQKLSGYVLNVAPEHRQATDPASWTRLGAYILDASHDGEKVAWAKATNCANDDPGWAVKDILSTQAHNARSKADKSYHLVASFPEGERPTREQIEDIEDRLCAALGYGEHQRVSAVHQNTDNWHLHIAINKVHPVTFRNVTPVRDYFRLQAACAELEIKHGLAQEPHTLDPRQSREGRARGRAGDFEARHGGQTFLAWTKEHAGAALLAARDSGQGWQAVHQVAGAFDLDVRPRGAGLIVAHRSDNRLHAKASDVDRGLSLKAMTDRLGPFEPPGEQAQSEAARTRYERPARSGALYEAFQREREAALQAREAATATLAAQHRDYARELAAYYRERLRQEHGHRLRGAVRQEAVQHIADQREQDRTARVERERQERLGVRAAHPIPNWQGYLEAEATKGNEAALASLRTRQLRAREVETELLTAAGAEEARHVVRQHMRPAIRRDGRVIYRMDDGGLVSDEARQVRVPQPTVSAAFLALSLAVERFGQRPLIVRGSDEFRARVATAAGIEGMDVAFADPALENRRLQNRARHGKDVARESGARDIVKDIDPFDRDGDLGR